MAMALRSGGLVRLARPFHHQRLSSQLPSWSSPYSSGVEIDDEQPARRKKASKSVVEIDDEQPFRRKKASISDQISGSLLPAEPPADPPSDTPEGDGFLLKSLKKELKEASHIINKYQVAIQGSFKPFELVPNVGTSNLTLRRVIGDEEVLVKCLLELEEPEDEEYLLNENEDELDIEQRLSLNIQISKISKGSEEPRLAFLCAYGKNETIVIEDIAYLGKSSYDEYPYSGPYFPDLDDKLQQAFHNVLKARGINSSLADLIMDHLCSKYQAEYILWLQNIRSFVKR